MTVTETKINATDQAIADFLGGSVEDHQKEPPSKFGWPSATHNRFDGWVVHDLFHWLGEACVYDADADKRWQGFYNGQQGGFWDLAPKFPEWYGKWLGRYEWATTHPNMRDDEPSIYVPGGIYGDQSGPVGEYTYNRENCLSSDIHFVYWEWQHEYGEDGYVLISLTGENSRTILLRTSIDGSGTIGWFDYDRWTIYCDGDDCHIYWSMGNGVEWNDSDYAKHRDKMMNLDEYNAREGDFIDAAFLNATDGILLGDEKPYIVVETPEGEYPGEHTKVWCPHCGKGNLQPAMY